MKTRFCPSPTGLVHLGNARTALFNHLLSEKESGCFLLRIEDTDQARSKAAFVSAIERDLLWLGCDWQEGPKHDGGNGPYVQSARQAIYARFYEQLLVQNLAYPCFATEEELGLMRKLQRVAGKPPRYDGRYANLSQAEAQEKIDNGTPYVLRLRVPDDAVIEFEDLIKGKQRFLGKDIGDFIIRRKDGMPTFMFCNAIDDSLMGVTHALRGEDHLTNTPRQLFILQNLGLRAPSYGHFSLMTELNGAKLSKRCGAQSVEDLRVQGYLPLALVNYLARLSHRYESEALMSFVELAAEIKLDHFSQAPSKFDPVQLERWQKDAVQALTLTEFESWAGLAKVPVDQRERFIDTVKPNVTFPQHVAAWVDCLFSECLTFTDEMSRILAEAGTAYFRVAHEAVEAHGLDIKAVIQSLKAELGLKGKALFQPLRIALTAQLHGPELGPLCELMGVDRVLARLNTV